jgi:hypothetical protein
LHVVYCFSRNTRADLLSKQRVEWILGRYANGIREYASLPDTVLGELVILGFLIPVMIGYFLPQSAANHESPIDQWVADAREAGFTNVSKHKLFEYVIGAERRILRILLKRLAKSVSFCIIHSAVRISAQVLVVGCLYRRLPSIGLGGAMRKGEQSSSSFQLIGFILQNKKKDTAHGTNSRSEHPGP